MFVYNEPTSMVTRIEFFGGGGYMALAFLRKAPVSLMKEGSFSAIGWRWWSTYSAMDDISLSIVLIMGRQGLPFLCIFGNI